MIADAVALQEARDGWEFVRSSRNVIVGNCNVATFAVGFNQAGIRDLCFNLLLASAFSVLEKVLRQLRDEGKFAGRDNRLGLLMSNSRSVLPWVDWALVDAGRSDRNSSVHARTYLPHTKCRDYIAAIERELVAWVVLPSATPDLWHW
jgi:hypothetical protein